MVSSVLDSHRLGRAVLHGWSAWRHIVHLGALVGALALSPVYYGRRWRGALALHLVRSSWPLLPWFTLLSTLLSVIIIRIVLVSARSYGLTQYALEMVVRVLVLELIPMTAALFVAMRVTIPAAGELAAMRRSDALEALRASGGDALRGEIAPRALAGMFAVTLLAALSSVIALLMAYLLSYGFSPWAIERYTRIVGHVFSPVVTLVFVLKTLALSAAVSMIPIGSGMHDREDRYGDTSVELRGLVRMFVVILLIEAASLLGNYL